MPACFHVRALRRSGVSSSGGSFAQDATLCCAGKERYPAGAGRGWQIKFSKAKAAGKIDDATVVVMAICRTLASEAGPLDYEQEATRPEGLLLV